MPQDLIGCRKRRKLKALIPRVVVFVNDPSSAERRIDFAVFFIVLWSYGTVLCKRIANEIRCFSFFALAKIRRNFAKRWRILVESNEISHPLKRNFVGAKIRNCEISQSRNFAGAKNSQLRNFHKAKFCWQWRRVVIKTFCSDRFKPLARGIYLV